jgi:hypothetical protein
VLLFFLRAQGIEKVLGVVPHRMSEGFVRVSWNQKVLEYNVGIWP